MYKVFCKRKIGGKWMEYSTAYQTETEAKDAKKRAEADHILDVNMNEIIYKIKRV